ncbi:hypothetical protein AB0H86_32415 [Streptomyces sp. NPDC050997]|uniref:hypothetical protein n=1 Tax=Streptomyces sp. NPDC050997 TaxID=3155519 RepID=UPI003437E3AE
MSDAQRDPETDTPPAGPGPWWAGLGPVAGGVLVACGGVLLLWLVLRGSGVEEHWAQYYGAAKVVAVGLVVAGTTLVARRGGKRHAE